MEQTLLQIPLVQVFKIPPRQTTRGYRATDWDSTQCVWQGRLRITTLNDSCTIKLEDPNTNDLFASCPYNEPLAVEAVVDSSRYFVLRIVDPVQQRHAFIGVGFQERNEAFDFNVTLQDFIKRKERVNQPFEMPTLTTDLSLKDGELITIDLRKQGKKPGKSTDNIIDLGGPIALPPPPPKISSNGPTLNSNDPFKVPSDTAL